MPQPSFIDADKHAALMPIESPLMCELVAVTFPDPVGTKWLAAAPYHEMPGYEGLKERGITVEARFEKDRFKDIQFSSGLGDETVTLDPADLDGMMRGLYAVYGPGLRVEAFYYFPEVDWLTSVWFGHLQPPDGATREVFKVKAKSGFRSGQLSMTRRAFYELCPVTFGGKLPTFELVHAGDCWYDRHVGGSFGNLDPVTGEPYRSCPKDVPACLARLEPAGATRALQHFGFPVVIESILNRQTKGRDLWATSRGNLTNLSRPLRAVFGLRRLRDLDLLEFTPQFNTNHPDKGFVRVLFAVCEGQIVAMWDCRVNDVLIGFNDLNVRLGAIRQPPTFFSPNVSNFSGTAHFFAVYGQVNPANYGPSNLSGSCMVMGLGDVKVYSSPTEFVRTLSTNRGWCLRRALSDTRWGYGLDEARLPVEDWIELAEWADEERGFTDQSGVQHLFTRSTLNIELIDKTVQQQTEDICNAGRFGKPFQAGGALRVLPLRAVEIDESVPVFTDEGDTGRNILRDAKTGLSTLSYSQKSDAEITNKLVANFDDAEKDWAEHPLYFEDEDAQLRAGLVFGDNTRRVVDKTVDLAGVTNRWEAAWVANWIFDVGEFDEGGQVNNFSVKFTTWFKYALDLYRYKVIEVRSSTVEPFGYYLGDTFHRFRWFRVQTIQRKSDLKCEITAQAYPREYYEMMEELATPLPRGEGVSGGVSDISIVRRGRPEVLGFAGVETTNDQIILTIERSRLALVA